MRMNRRDWLAAATTAPAWASAAAPAAVGGKTLRVAFNFAETGFDPPQVGDLTSISVNSHIFEALLTYDYLARPVKLRPLTAAALPEVSADFRRFVFQVRPGIFFADDPAFGGRARELTAADYVYSFKRFDDPQLHTEHLHLFENEKILGLTELRRRAIVGKTAFPYDAAVEGLRVLDRYRFEVRLANPSPRFVHLFAYNQTAAVAREVVEAYASDLMAHPVGTGPFMLQRWRRGSLITLVRNPRFREQLFEAEPPADDAQSQALAAALRGKRLPLLDRVEVSIIEESQPRWLAFVGGELDAVALPTAFADLALRGGQLAPYLARRGVRSQRTLGPSIAHTFFNFDDPVVGGYTAERVALRRAVALCVDNAAEIRRVYQGQAIPAQSMIAPDCYGYDPALKSDMSAADAARANALLDLYGYARRGRAGHRQRPDGQPLVLRLASQQNLRSRQINELWKARMDAIGLDMRFEYAPFGELIKRSLAGQLMMWGFTWSIGAPDADFLLGLAYGPNRDQSNDARFALPAFDRLYERQHVMPDSPERLALMREANKLMLAYVPYIAHNHPITTDLTQPWVRGYHRHPFTNDWWRYTDLIDRS